MSARAPARRWPAVWPWMTVGLTSLALLFAIAPDGPLGLWPATALAGASGCALAFAGSPKELRPQLRLARSSVSWGLLGGAVMALLTHALYPLCVAWLPGLREEALALYARLDRPPGRYAAVPIVLLVVIAEELVWRGIAYPRLAQRFGRPPAVVIATLLYALPQLASGSWLLPLLALGCGTIWTLQRAYSGNLIVPCLTHAVWDLLVMVAFPLAR